LCECVQLVQSTSESAALIEDIELLHIDGNHSETTSLIDVTKWVPQVKKGGIIIFDDVNWVTTGPSPSTWRRTDWRSYPSR
jgi:hypothetical protein